ncbi:MAG: hypothetical protein ABL888_09980 [Pirellulaceae bacterium]
MKKRFSIRTLLIVTTITAIVLALPIRGAIRQRQGREWVAAQRGRVSFQHNYGQNFRGENIKAGSNLIGLGIAIFGIDLFDTVTGIVFDCDTLVDLAPLRYLPSVRVIGINIDMADEIDFSPLTKLPELEEIHFTKWTNLNEQQLDFLERLLPNVEIISESHPNRVRRK